MLTVPDVETAVEAWRFALAGVFPLVDSWCDFVPLHQRYAVSEDTWQQVLDFSCTIGADLSMYDSDVLIPLLRSPTPFFFSVLSLSPVMAGAWPVLIDEFVECYSRREHLGLSCDVCGRRPSVLLRSPSSHAFCQHTLGSSNSSLSSFNEARWLTTNGGATTATPVSTTATTNLTDADMAEEPLSSLQASSLQASLSTPSALLSALSVQAASIGVSVAQRISSSLSIQDGWVQLAQWEVQEITADAAVTQ
ncbi:unnamed protein product [Closterium sp. Yama58-4]|nr:unnamed protein product [Closterium sp. Yama58-4]